MSGERLKVHVVPTGAANLASVRAGLLRAGASVVLGATPQQVQSAPALVLPGVGAFGPAMQRLRREGLVDPLRARFEAGKPTLCICLGMQLLFEASEESPGLAGLGVLEGAIRSFSHEVLVPHFGWNRVEPGEKCELLTGGYAYFANSYRRIDPGDDSLGAQWQLATTDYDGRFLSALERGALLACQFHPELSGAMGRELLVRWLRRAGKPQHETEEGAR